MPFHFLPAGKILDSLSEGDKALQIGLFYKLSEAVLEEYIDDLSYTVEIFICMPES